MMWEPLGDRLVWGLAALLGALLLAAYRRFLRPRVKLISAQESTGGHGERLFAKPLRLRCGAVLDTRLVKASMTEQMCTGDGVATSELIQLYVNWAATGGVGALITGNVMIDRRFREGPFNIVLDPKFHFDLRGAHMRALRRMCDSVRDAWSGRQYQMWAQLSHAGRQCPGSVAPTCLAPSACPKIEMPWYLSPVSMLAFSSARALTATEIEDVRERFVQAAMLCWQSGFTGVQVHSAHGYLLSSFLSPRTNRRHDHFGGSPENRRRLLLQIVNDVRRRVDAAIAAHDWDTDHEWRSPDFVIAVKVNSADFQKGGLTHEDSLEVVHALAQTQACDVVEISGGNYENPMLLQGRSGSRHAFFVDFARLLAKQREEWKEEEREMRVMVTGGFRAAAAMNDALSSGILDVVGIARPLAVNARAAQQLCDGDVQVVAQAEVNVPLREVNAMVQNVWHQHQMRRIARGRLKADFRSHPLLMLLKATPRLYLRRPPSRTDKDDEAMLTAQPNDRRWLLRSYSADHPLLS